jgi:cytochrome P450
MHHAFTPNGVLEYERHVDGTVHELIKHLKLAGPNVDLALWLNYFAFDTMARIGFSEDQGFMQKKEDVGGAIEFSLSRFKHWNDYWTVPWLDSVIFKNWYARNRKKPRPGLMSLAIRIVQDRKLKAVEAPDLLNLYLDCGRKDSELWTIPTILGITGTTIQAGSELVAYTSAICMYALLANPRTLAKLRAELESVAPATEATGWQLPPMSILRRITYLEACIKESARLYPAINLVSERVVSAPAGATIAGVFVPQGTIVAVNNGGLYTNPGIWGDDVEVYRPERWLKVDEARRVAQNQAFLAFLTGRRMCLGIHVAWLEMRKVISALVMGFEVCLSFLSLELTARCWMTDCLNSSHLLKRISS